MTLGLVKARLVLEISKMDMRKLEGIKIKHRTLDNKFKILIGHRSGMLDLVQKVPEDQKPPSFKADGGGVALCLSEWEGTPWHDKGRIGMETKRMPSSLPGMGMRCEVRRWPVK